MERNINNRVFINPNFKRTEIDSWPTEPIRTTHFNRHYVEDISNRVTYSKSNQKMSNNRKIYVNPNFISGGNATQSTGYMEMHTNFNKAPNMQQKSTYYLEQNFHHVHNDQARPREINKNNTWASNLEVNFNCNSRYDIITQSKQLTHESYIENNKNVNNAPNSQLLHKSKYSLIQTFQQSVLNKEQTRNIMETSKNNTQASNIELFQNTKEKTQEVPLTKSRYCIIRKKKRLSVTAEHKSDNSLPTDLVTVKYPKAIACSNQLTCYTNIHAVKNSDINKPKTPEKITKIKITKYKIIPISYLKNNSAIETNGNKHDASPSKPYLKNNTKLRSTLITSNKNRYRFIKSSTPVKSSNPVLSPIKVASRLIQHTGKGVCSGSKAKFCKTRTKFNINNIPCRLYKKYGKCLRQDQGNCKYLHDKKLVSLCRKFLKGICHDENCSLSHELTAKKMPTCYFYLKGMCTKDACPYLHVKLSDKTKICQEFAKGYCESGDKCPFKHVNVKQVEKSSKTSSYNIRKPSQNKDTKSNRIKIEKRDTESCDTVTNSEKIIEKDDEDCRYYKELVNSDDSFENIKPKRCKLGTLPSFIQL